MNLKRSLLLLAALIIPSVLVLCLHSRRYLDSTEIISASGESSGSSVLRSVPPRKAAKALRAKFVPQPVQVVYAGSDLIEAQWIQYGGGLYPSDSTRLAVMNDNNGDDLVDQSWEFSASFAITRVCGRGIRDHFYVQGVNANGEDVLEHWRKAAVGGVGGLAGGGAGQYLMLRSPILQGNQLNGILDFDCDPTGTFLWVVHDNPHRISRVRVSNGNTVVLFDQATLPGLANIANPAIYTSEHSSQGLHWILEGMAIDTAPDLELGSIFFTDVDGGGYWEPTYLDAQTRFSSYPDDDWVTDHAYYYF